jgi:membrane protein
MISPKHLIRPLKAAFQQFTQANVLKLSAALSYYAVFSLAPLIIIIISFAGIFLGKEAVQGKIYGKIKDFIGNDAARQVADIILKIQQGHHTVAGTIIGFGVLIFCASGMFSEIQDSIDYLWGVRHPAKNTWLNFLILKLWSFCLLGAMAFILLVSLLANTLIDLLSTRLGSRFSPGLLHLFYSFNILLIFCIITSLFTIIFKLLPDKPISWRDAISGALLTAVLFILGKFAISFYLDFTHVGLTYGVTTSVVMVMLWVYYSSMILYFGACFVRALAIGSGRWSGGKG